jgi:hypothetical protein
MAKEVQNFAPDALELQAHVHQELCGDSFPVPHQAQEEMLSPDIVMRQLPAFFV